MSFTTRRGFLEVMGLAAGGFLLRSTPFGGQAFAQTADPKFLLLVYFEGGWDQLLSLDPRNADAAAVPARLGPRAHLGHRAGVRADRGRDAVRRRGDDGHGRHRRAGARQPHLRARGAGHPARARERPLRHPRHEHGHAHPRGGAALPAHRQVPARAGGLGELDQHGGERADRHAGRHSQRLHRHRVVQRGPLARRPRRCGWRTTAICSP